MVFAQEKVGATFRRVIPVRKINSNSYFSLVGRVADEHRTSRDKAMKTINALEQILRDLPPPNPLGRLYMCC